MCIFLISPDVAAASTGKKNGTSIKNIKGKKGSNEFRGKWTLMVLALLVFGVTNYWKFDKHTKLSPHAWRECGEVLSTC